MEPKSANYPQAIKCFAWEAGIDFDSVGEILESTEVTDGGKTFLQYTFRIFSPDTTELFILATSLGHLFGPKNVLIDEYKATPKYMGHAKISIKVNQQ